MLTSVVNLTEPAELDAVMVNSPLSCFIVDGICIMKWPSFSARIRYLWQYVSSRTPLYHVTAASRPHSMQLKPLNEKRHTVMRP